MNKIFQISSIITLLLFVITNSAESQTVVINEVQYSNQNTIRDSENNTPDWIEILNSGEVPVNLKGYQLTDDISKSDYWIFPDYRLQPDSFLLVFASGKNEQFGDEIHTDFLLRLMKDPVYFMEPSGEIIDMIKNQCVPPDKSIGRWPETSDHLEILTPTPGFSNNSAQVVEIEFQTDTIGVSHQSGFFSESISIGLFNKHLKNEIYYTLNGEKPDIGAFLYEDLLILDDINQNKNRFANLTDTGYKPGDLIAKANILRAVVLSEGCPASEEIIHTYFIDGNRNIDYQFPVVSLITEKDKLFGKETGIYVKGNHKNYSKRGKEWERPVHLEIFNEDGIQIIDQDAGLRINGSASRAGAQKSLRLYAREEYGKDTFEYPFFTQKPSLDRFKTLLLRSKRGWAGSLFTDELCHNLVQDLNIDYSATQTAIVFINGEYWGIHSLRERQDIAYIENNFGMTDPEVEIVDYEWDQVRVKEGSIDGYNELIDHMENLDARSEEFYSFVDEAIDLESITDYFIAEIYLANSDFPYNNVELWRVHNDTSKWRFFFFDFDGAMYRITQNQLSQYNNNHIEFQISPEHTTFLFRTLLKNPEYRNYFRSQFTYHLNTTFSPDRVIDTINEFEEKYRPIASEHIYRWNKPVDYNKWIHNIGTLRLFAIQRPQVIFDQISENFSDPFVLFPNPSKDYINLVFFDIPENALVKIFTMNGQLVQAQNLSGHERVTIHHVLTPGAYFMQVVMGPNIYNRKLIVQ